MVLQWNLYRNTGYPTAVLKYMISWLIPQAACWLSGGDGKDFCISLYKKIGPDGNRGRNQN